MPSAASTATSVSNGGNITNAPAGNNTLLYIGLALAAGLALWLFLRRK